jgi:transposase
MPSFMTINRFRSEYLKDVLEDIFTQVLDLLHEKGYIHFETYFIDGTKLEANANKHTYVWKKNTVRYKEMVKERVKHLFEEIEQINQQEDRQYGDQDLAERGIGKTINPDEIKTAAKKINDQLRADQPKKSKQKLERIARHLEKEAKHLTGYEQQEKILGERSSFSKTDPDATYMQTKGKQIRPAYNVHISTENQFITHCSVSQNAGDSAGFTEHVDQIEARGEDYLPKNYSSDSGYGNEENYQKLEALDINNYMKFSNFHHEQTNTFKKNPFLKEHFLFDPQQDYYICPKGRKLSFREQRNVTTKTGYKSQVKIYECESCDGCEFKDKCCRSKGNRSIDIREKLESYKNQVRNNLNSEKGIKLRKQRSVDVEPVFGDWKYNQGYTRLRLRGSDKVLTDIGWLSLSHNIRKLHIRQRIAV